MTYLLTHGEWDALDEGGRQTDTVGGGLAVSPKTYIFSNREGLGLVCLEDVRDDPYRLRAGERV